MTEQDIRAQLTDEQALCMTIWAEAKGEPIDGQIAVGHVIRNRMVANPKRFGGTWKEACLKRKQFSCWNDGTDANHLALMDMCRRCMTGQRPWPTQMIIAQGVMRGLYMDDQTHGATHYYNPAGMVPKGRKPVWAEGVTPVAVIGQHIFYKGV